jgi:DNA-directed RNA polymerase subunit K/omega
MNTQFVGGELKELEEVDIMPTFTQLGGALEEVDDIPLDQEEDKEPDDDELEDNEGEDDEAENGDEIDVEDDDVEDIEDGDVEDIEDGDVEDIEDDEEFDDEEAEDGDEEDEDEEQTGATNSKKKVVAATKRTKKVVVQEPEVDYGIDSDEDDDIELEKFDNDTREEYLLNYHPESSAIDFDEVRALCTIVRDEDGDIVDPFHTTIPFMTKYEKARILGLRAKQLNSNIRPSIEVPEYVIDSYRIAELELEKKSVPFIIRRPLPDGRSEYWRVSDLIQIC